MFRRSTLLVRPLTRDPAPVRTAYGLGTEDSPRVIAGDLADLVDHVDLADHLQFSAQTELLHV